MKGYKLYNLSTNSTFISRNVIFHEIIFPYASNLINSNADGFFTLNFHFDPINIDHSILINDIQTLNPLESINSQNNIHI
jgi:hypothetical protein